jgi:TPR repeat protein
MMRDGSAARPDPDGALTMFGVACAQGELQGCFEEGRMLAELGKLRKGASVLSDACERRHAASCELLGEMVATGRGVARSKRRASKLFRRACLSGRTEACTRL